MWLASATVYADWTNWQSQIIAKQQTLPGWCGPSKATAMMDLIYKTKPQLCVEIGVFGGSSLFPTACALQYLNCGQVYGIDSWSHTDCCIGYKIGDPDYEWWSQVPLMQIHHDLENLLKKHHLDTYCRLLCLSSQDACSYFTDGSIDILHIDGNHSEASTLQDVQMFFPKVKSGGYIWLNDTDRVTAAKAVWYLCLHADLDEGRSAFAKRESNGTVSCYLLFKKP